MDNPTGWIYAQTIVVALFLELDYISLARIIQEYGLIYLVFSMSNERIDTNRKSGVVVVLVQKVSGIGSPLSRTSKFPTIISTSTDLTTSHLWERGAIVYLTEAHILYNLGRKRTRIRNWSIAKTLVRKSTVDLVLI